MLKIGVTLIMFLNLAHADILCTDSVNNRTLIMANKPYAQRPVKSQILKALEADHKIYQLKLSQLNTAESNQSAAKKSLLDAKTQLTWRDWFGVRHLFFRSRHQTQDYKVTQNKLEEATKALWKANSEFGQVKKQGTALIRANNPRVLQFFERSTSQLLKRAVITPEGQSVSKISILSIESSSLDFSYPLGLKTLPMERATLITEVTIGKEKIRLPIEVEFYPGADRIIKMGIVELPAYSQKANRPYNHVYAGFVYQPGLKSVSSHSPIQKYAEKHGLKVPIEKMRLIQKRVQESRALKQQVETVLAAAQASKTTPTDDLMTSYFYYWAFSGHPFSMMFMPPTHWFLLNLTHPHDIQIATSKVIEHATNNLNQGVEVTLTDVQNNLKSTIPNIEEISPIYLKTPDVDAQTWEKNINDMSLRDLSPEIQTSIADRLQQSVDIEAWRNSSVELGMDPLGDSPNEISARDIPDVVNETVDVEPSYDSPSESYDSGSSDSNSSSE